MFMAHSLGRWRYIVQERSFTSRVQPYCFLFVTLLFFIVNLVTSSGGANSGANHTDQLALMAIKSLITHDPHGTLGMWNTSVHFCRWEGVTCGQRHRRVTVLDLSSRGLVGFLSPHVGNLSFLRFLRLSNNTFSGGITPEIGNLFRLRCLNLSSNSFQGEIPPSLSNCTDMRELGLDGNKFVGKLPSELFSLAKLNVLTIKNNNITGGVPLNIGNLTSLQKFSMTGNPVGGTIPHSLGNLRNLQALGLGDANLSGTIPPSLYNLSSLLTFDLGENQISGKLPEDIGLKLPYLQYLLIWANQFTGSIPLSLSNCSNLIWFDLSENKFSVKRGFSFGKMSNLQRIIIYANNIGNGEHDDMKLIKSMTNCSKLQWLDLAAGQIRGVLPNTIGNLSTQLTSLQLGENFIYGPIPSTIGNLAGLELLELHENQLIGPIPSTFGNLVNLQELYLERNILDGKIPNSLGNLSLVIDLSLADNKLESTIPPDIGHCQNLILLNLSTNNLVGRIPIKILGLSSLSIALDLSQNHLDGPLPQEIGNLKNLMQLDVSNNRLDGEIPYTIASCVSLQYAHLQRNKFQGSLPPTIGSLKGIQWLDLSVNNLSGQIPQLLEKLSLSYLNLSFNNFEGKVPMEGVFRNTSGVAIVGNDMLCGGVSELRLPKCSKKKGKGLSVAIVVVISLCSLLGFIAMATSLLFCYLKRKKQASTQAPTMQSMSRLSYGSLFKATDGFNERNLIGSGSFSSVYKGIIEPDGKMVAIKVLQLRNQGASKSFIVECEILRNTRHRNLLKIITSCSSTDFQMNEFKALVYEYMPNGNLEKWLHPSPQTMIDNPDSPKLNLYERLIIATDVALAIQYLHQDCKQPIIHCDLKPTNILLDEDMVAHVGDFGLARFLSLEPSNTSHNSSVGIRGTIGYTAPEYGLGSEISREGDVYSFGILLLEMMTGKKPTNSMFQGMNLHSYVKMALPLHVMAIVEPNLLFVDEEEARHTTGNRAHEEHEGNKWSRLEECMISWARIGVACSMESPKDRMKLSKAIQELNRIKGILVPKA